MDNSIIINIDSSKRLSGTNSDFTYAIPSLKTLDYERVTLLSINIPQSYYVVQSGEYMILTENGMSVDITIPQGNYTANSFIQVIPPLLNSASPNGWTYTCSISNSYTQTATGLFTFTVSGNSGQPSFSFVENSFVHEQFGFDDLSTNTFTNNTLTSSNVVKFVAETSLYLHSDLIQTENGDDVLQEIYNNNASQFSNIVYYNSAGYEAYSKKLRNNSSNVYSFRLTDETFTRIINLHGNNMVFTLLFYKPKNIDTLLKNYLIYKLKTE